jgi:hypothetical protein
MANKNQVTLTFAGDADKLTTAFDDVGTAAKSMDTKVGAASHNMGAGFDRAGEGLDNTYDKFDSLEAVGRGTSDTMSGFGAIMAGDVLGGSTDLAGGVAALADGIGGALIPALKKSVVWLGQTKVGMVAMELWSKAVGAATKVWTGIQAAFNFVMALNPVTIIIIAIVALIAVIVLIATRTKWFQKLWHAIWEKIGGPVKAAWHGILVAGKAALNWLSEVPGKVGGFFKRVGSAIAAPFKAGFRMVRDAWNNTIGGKGFTIPNWVPGMGGKSFRIPKFHTGGVVSGAFGSETLAVLRAGERVTPNAAGGAPTVIEVRAGGGGTSVERAVATMVLSLIRTGAVTLQVRDNKVVAAGA